MRIVCLLKIAVSGFLAFASLANGPAQAQGQNVKFVLDWKFQGYHAPWALGIERGYFAAEGLNVQMDSGAGAGDVINKVASGAYDIGFGDVNPLIKFNAENPDKRVIAVLMVMEKSVNAIGSLKSSNINSPKDLAGKKIGGAQGDAVRQMFPIFAKLTGLDPASVTWETITFQLRAPLLASRSIDAATGFIPGLVFDLAAVGVKREDIALLKYSDYGLDLYSNALLVSTAYAEKNPEMVRKFIRATVKGLRESIADQPAGIAALKKRDPLIDSQLELDRFKLYIETSMLTQNVQQHGFGVVDNARFAKSISYVAEAFNIQNPPSVDQVYSGAYLPPAAERQVK